jgi:serine/threonine protein kinase
MPSQSTPPGVAALLQNTVRFPQGSGQDQLPRVRRRVLPLQPAHAPVWSAEDDEGPTRLRVLGQAERLPEGWGPAGSGLLRPDAIGPGSVIGNYRIIEPLANGGMGIVYRGEHMQLRRQVAIKFLHQRLLTDRWAVARFFSEAIAASRISHPGAVSVFDYGTTEGGAFLVMELLRGETLSARLERERRLPIPTILDFGMQLGMTLAAAHDAGVIHRDLKPDNIFLVPDPAGSGREFVKVLDFGVAKLTYDHAAPTTQRGDLLGTPLYMAPEQSVHAGSVDARCDIYSLGCVLYQLITGMAPFRGSMFEILIAHQKEPPPSPRSYDPTIPHALDELVLRMMNKSPDGRPASMSEVVCVLGGIDRERFGEVTRRPGFRASAIWLGLFFGLGLMFAGLNHLSHYW